MVDLLGLLNAVQPYAPSAADTIKKLSAAVICGVNGVNHEGAGGLSLYYPLSVQGTEELSIFADICTGSYYLAYVDSAAYGTTGGDVGNYDNSSLIADCDDIRNDDYTADPDVGSDYSYSMSLYDIYGNYYYTTEVTFTVDENGDLFFYPDELA